MEKQSSYSRHTHTNAEGTGLPYGHHLLGFRVETLFEYWGLCLHRRPHSLGDATVALLSERCKRGKRSGEGTASLRTLLATELALLLQGHAASILPELLPPHDPTRDRWDPSSAESVAGRHVLKLQALRDRSTARAACGTGERVHWMLRLRYCRNMLASWGKFSSLGCILV